MARNLGYSFLGQGFVDSNKPRSYDLPDSGQDYSLRKVKAGSSESNPIVDRGQFSPKEKTPLIDASTKPNVGFAAGKGAFKILAGYMESDAIRQNANYEADVLQLNADLNLFEARQQLGVDVSNIIRKDEQSQEIVDQTRALFAELEQEGGAAQDIIKENSFQASLNHIAMINEAQAKVSSAEFGRKLAYLKAKNMRDISRAQGRQARLAGYIGGITDIGSAIAGNYGQSAGG